MSGLTLLLASGLPHGLAHGATGPAARPDSDASPHQISAKIVSSSDRSGDPLSELDGSTGQATSGTYIDEVGWIPDQNGQRLAVYPTDHGRYEAPASEWPDAWDEVVRMEPDADHPHMRDQFRCHVEFARIAEVDKPSWNLELWRPDVGYLATVLASCNPE
ncbi:DUF2599 domain-containing protein [Phytoactinopolyspora endophytica]|uniref:DUF2599 domain-containing protein n=1 Tax=Phytoactinopolyspora endophytica TaxID=1642495 RepID=UPI0013EC8140|nr:DUF2599 domain-containing protein [Phytoactinopolyspora endophytica]